MKIGRRGASPIVGAALCGRPSCGRPRRGAPTDCKRNRNLHRRHGGHGDFTEASGFSVHLRVLRVSVVNRVLEFFSILASRNSSGDSQFPIRNLQSEIERFCWTEVGKTVTLPTVFVYVGPFYT